MNRDTWLLQVDDLYVHPNDYDYHVEYSGAFVTISTIHNGVLFSRFQAIYVLNISAKETCYTYNFNFT